MIVKDDSMPAYESWLQLLCRCANKVGPHGCHAKAERAAKALGEPTQRDRQVADACG